VAHQLRSIFHAVWRQGLVNAPPAEVRADSAADAYVPLKALCIYSGLSVRKLREYLVDPTTPLPHYRVGGKILVRRSECDEWMRAFRVTPIAESLDAVVNETLRGL
jgi:hypothetical protein